VSAASPHEPPVPDFYRSADAALWDYRADPAELGRRAEEWRARHGIRAAAADRAHVELLLVDLQRDFCLPGGALYVGGRSGRGALDDTDRVVRFLYRNLDRITGITATLDTHHPFQIFFADFWLDAAGARLSPFREVTAAQVRRGEARPDPALAGFLAGGDAEWLRRQALDYCERLEAAGKYRLYLWPPHCLAGGDGHALTGVVQAARLFHAWCRRAPNRPVLKGEAALSEHYSALAPEVLRAHDGGPLGEVQRALCDRLFACDAVVVAGQAASHCVKATVEDLIAEAGRRDPGFVSRIWLLEDAMSAIAVPDPERPGEFLVDFTAEVEATLARFAAAGVRRLRTTDPLPAP
jgi:nicotinamidase-related amidase